MISAYVAGGGFAGHQSIEAVFAQIPDTLAESLTAKQLGEIGALLYKAYKKGEHKTDAEATGGDLWIGYGVDKCLPLDALRAITVEETVVPVPGSSYPSHITRYQLDYTERH
jgi:hypothetical protein